MKMIFIRCKLTSRDILWMTSFLKAYELLMVFEVGMKKYLVWGNVPSHHLK